MILHQFIYTNTVLNSMQTFIVSYSLREKINLQM